MIEVSQAIESLLKMTPADKAFHILEDNIAIVRDGFRIEDIRNYADRPDRIREKIVAGDLPSFFEYFTTFQMPASVVFLKLRESVLRAVIDYHGPSTASWATHVVDFHVMESTDFRALMSANNKPMSQDDFCEWVDEYAHLFAEPAGTKMLELAQKISMRSSESVSSLVNVATGERQVSFEQNSGPAGNLSIPSKVVLVCRTHQDFSVVHQFQARIVPKIKDKKLVITLKILQYDEAISAIMKNLVEQVRLNVSDNTGKKLIVLQ